MHVVAVPVVVEGAQQATQAGHALLVALQWLGLLRQRWLQSLGPFLFALASVAVVRNGLLNKLHTLYTRCMTLVLRERPAERRRYKHSFLHAAESPLKAFCIMSVVCHAAALAARIMAAKKAKDMAFYCDAVVNLSSKVCFGLFLYGVVNEKITRSSRGIAKKSDILGAETSRQESQVLAVGQTARVLVILATCLACLPVFRVNISTVLSFCGMGGLAISLLSKGVIVNLIGSLTIYLTQPFTLGDWIQTVDKETDGWVQSMGPYHTVVMRWDRRPEYIPNSKLTQIQIINASRMTNRRILIDIPIRFGDLDKIDGILEDVRELIQRDQNVDEEMHRLVHLREIKDYAAMIWVSCYTKSINLEDWVSLKESLWLSITRIVFKYGTTFANTLDREVHRVDPTGAFLADPDDPASGASSLGSNADDEVFKRQPLLPSQKKEVQSLKQKQKELWAREKDLKDSEADLQDERERLGQDESELERQREGLEQKEVDLDAILAEVAQREETLQAQESEIDAEMDELQAREDSLDVVLQDWRSKGVGTDSPVQSALGTDFLKKTVEDQGEKLSRERKELEQEREILKKQKAEREALTQDDSSDVVDEGAPQEDEEAPEFQKKAEELGGE